MPSMINSPRKVFLSIIEPVCIVTVEYENNNKIFTTSNIVVRRCKNENIREDHENLIQPICSFRIIAFKSVYRRDNGGILSKC